MADYDVIVIGSGLGGLSSGGICASRGRKVLILEQSDMVGGCCSTFEREGYHFDVGASIVEAIPAVEDSFKVLNTSIDKELDLIPCDPVMSFVLEDGTRFEFPKSVEETTDVIRKIAPEDADAWPKFAGYMKEFNALAKDAVFGSPMVTIGDAARMFMKFPALFKYGELFTSSYGDILRKWFKTSTMQQTASYQSFYVGLPPGLAAGVYAILGYLEHEGVYYPRGGMRQIPLAYKRIGEKSGMEVRTDTLVDRVIVRNRRAEGVVLADGSEITAPVVISDVNAMTLYLELIGEEHLPWLARVGIKSYIPTISVPMVYLGVDYEPELNAHHTLVTRSLEDMDDYWWNVYEKNKLTDQMFGIVCCATKSDPALAPEGHHALNLIMMPASTKLEGTDWDTEKEAYIERAIDFFTRSAMPGLKDHVTVADMTTPLDFERRLLLPEGAIYGLEESTPATLVFRPSAKSKSIKGLYLAGASTHPGGGVPLTISSGMIAADLIEKHEQ
jgi:phytoene desaturase